MLTAAAPAALRLVRKGEASVVKRRSGKLISELQGNLNRDQDSPGPVTPSGGGLGAPSQSSLWK